MKNKIFTQAILIIFSAILYLAILYNYSYLWTIMFSLTNLSIGFISQRQNNDQIIRILYINCISMLIFLYFESGISFLCLIGYLSLIYEKNFKYPKKFKIRKAQPYTIIRKGFIKPNSNKYDFNKIPQDIDAIIIGSGIGGLTAGGLLSKCGYRILILEQHETTAGGSTHNFEDHGIEYDTGIHYIGNMKKRKAILDLLCQEPIKWDKMGSEDSDFTYDEIYIQGNCHKFRASKEKFIQDLAEKFPTQLAGLNKYIELIEKVAQKELFFNIKTLKPKWLAKLIGKCFLNNFYKYIDQSTYQVISQIITDKNLISILTSQFGDVGAPPKQSSFFMHASIVYHYLDGGWYPQGGSSIFANRIIPTIEKNGGTVLIGQAVKKILIDNNRAYGIEMANGDKIYSRIVISDAGLFNTYQKLILPEIAIQDPLYNISKQIKPSCSLVYLFVGLNGTKSELKLRSTNIWSLQHGDFDKLLDDYYKDPFNINCRPIIFLGFPSAKDSTWNNRHPGKSCAVILAPCKYEEFKSWENLDHKTRKQNQEYITKKNLFKNMLLEELFKYYPNLRDKILETEIGTPLTFNHYIGSTYGEVYGLEASSPRFHNLDIRPDTKFKYLYLTGQDITTVGFTGAMMAGVLTAHNILGYGGIIDALSSRNLIDDILHMENKYWI